MRKRLGFMLFILGISAAPALAIAQDATTPVTGDVTADGSSTSDSTARYDALSPGNKMIARSLFDAQGQTGGGLTASANAETPEASRWTLEQIAAARAEGQGWGEIFQQMKADGVITAKSLGQVVSRHHVTPHAQSAATGTGTAPTTGASTSAARSTPRSVLITSATNDVSVAGPERITSAGGGSGKSTSPGRGKNYVASGQATQGQGGGHFSTTTAGPMTTGAAPTWAGGNGGITGGNGRGHAFGRGK